MAAPLAFPLQQTSFGEEVFYRLLDDLFAAGVRDSAAFAVAQRAAGANMSVDVAAGEAVVAVNLGGKRLVRALAVSNSGTPGAPNTTDNWTQTFTSADGTLPRIDRVVLQVRDTDVDPSFSTRDVAYRVVTGIPTSGATLANLSGAAAPIASQLLLANVLIPNGSTSITTANIDATFGTVRALAGAYGQGWQAYTPTWTGTIGNGTKVGRFVQIGKTVIGHARIVWGSTTTHPAAVQTVGVPVPASYIQGLSFFAHAVDASAGEFKVFGRASTVNDVSFFSGGEGTVGAIVTNTVPFTWTTSDELRFNFMYEAA